MRQVIKHRLYERALKDINKAKGVNIQPVLDDIIHKLATDQHPGNHVHNLQKTSVAKSGLTGLAELHITGELLLIFRKSPNSIELVDICKNHKDLKKRY